MRKHAGDTRVRKHSRMERFLLPDHATEQAIVQIGHRRFLQLANCFSKLFSKLASCLASLASGSGAGVGQLQDRTEVSHPRGDVRFAGPVHFTSSFLLSARFRGGPTRDRVVFINPGRERRKKWPLPESRAPMTWPYACSRSRTPSARGGKLPPKDPLLMKTSRFLAGLCLGSSQRGAACAGRRTQASRATRTPGRSCRSGPMLCSTANPSTPCSALPP